MPKLTWNPPVIPARTATYHWGVDYAAEVHEGSGNKPARRWTDYAIEHNPPDQLMAKHFNDSVLQAFDDMAYDLSTAFYSAIESDIWAWPRLTIRHDGLLVGSPRDIVDTGALINSQTMTLS
jgi:hypothetical protein